MQDGKMLLNIIKDVATSRVDIVCAKISCGIVIARNYHGDVDDR